MKAISLWQPWATLVAIGALKFLVRDLSTYYRGPLAIHAAKDLALSHADWCRQEPVAGILRKAGIGGVDVMPLGAILCVVELHQCYTIAAGGMYSPGLASVRNLPDQSQLQLGSYAVGSHVLELLNVRRLPAPLDYPGVQGFFDVPDELVAEVANA